MRKLVNNFANQTESMQDYDESKQTTVADENSDTSKTSLVKSSPRKFTIYTHRRKSIHLLLSWLW
jgi:hypothetical protein